MTRKNQSEAQAPAAYLLPARPSPAIWGLTPERRLELMLAKAGVPGARRGRPEEAPRRGAVLLLRGEAVCNEAFLRGLLARPETLAVGPDGEPLAAHVPAERMAEALRWLEGEGAPPSGLAPAKAWQIGEAYDFKLRKRETPFAEAARADRRPAIENRLYAASYKGVTDFVTKYLWPLPARELTRLCARLGVGPNAVTLVGAAFMLAALWLFWRGEFGLGLAAAWAMALLDTVDGKLARVTLSSSKFGDVLDHGIDLIHPPFWYVAWGYGLAASGAPLPEGWLGPLNAAIVIAYIAARLCEGYFIRRFGFHLHVWRPFDSRFRLVLARRNPNLALLTLPTLFARPDVGFILVAVWSALTVAVHLVQVASAEAARARGLPPRSWLEERPPAVV